MVEEVPILFVESPRYQQIPEFYNMVFCLGHSEGRLVALYPDFYRAGASLSGFFGY